MSKAGKQMIKGMREALTFAKLDVENAELNAENARLCEDNARLRGALGRIANTVAFLEDDVQKVGYKIDGREAVRLANEPGYLREIARAALQPKE